MIRSLVPLLVIVGLSAADLANVRVSWIGNSVPHGGSASVPAAWVPQDIAGIAVAADGTVYTNIFWEEGGANQTAMREGQVLGMAGGSHGWGHQGGTEVAVNEKWLFFSQRFDNEGGGLKDPEQWPPKGAFWYGISRRLRSDITRGEPFAGGKGGKESPKGCFLPIHETGENAAISGLCCAGGELFVASTWDDHIRVLDPATMVERRRFPCEDPGRMAVIDDRLWVLLGDGTRIRPLHPDGASAGADLVLPTGCFASGIAGDAQGRLYVADRGPAAQVLVYANLDHPVLQRRIGKAGGILAGPVPGRFGNRRFHAISDIGIDGSGNLMVVSTQEPASGCIVESYDAQDQLRWRLLGLEFVDRICEDPADHTSLYSKETRYALDWSQPPGQEWTYRALTLDTRRFPLDPRPTLGLNSPFFRRIAGQPFLVCNGQNAASTLAVLRFDHATHGEIAIPCLVLEEQPNGKFPDEPKGPYVWIDRDGDGQPSAAEYNSLPATKNGKGPWAGGFWIDASGALWFAGNEVRRVPFRGLDTHGVPDWDWAATEVVSAPAPLTAVKRLRYDAANDTLFVGGIDAEHQNQHWKPMGPVLARYDGWQLGKREATWSVIATYEEGRKGRHISCEPISFDVAGDYVFISICGPSKNLGIDWGTVEVRRADDGSLVGHMSPNENIGRTGLMDMVECIRAFKRTDGEYIIILEEDRCAKNIIYRWKP
jgi:hypothetical protein